jgi:PAS domain S-box-containing protein
MLEELAAEMGFGLQRLRDQAQLVKSQQDQSLLSHAIEQATESVMVLDPDFVILYANAATMRSSGYTLDEILGSHPRIFGSGLHSQEFFEESEHELASGRPWHGIFVNRRKTGELYEEDTTISPVFDAAGTIVAYTEVRYDLTAERQLASELTRARSDQDAIVEIMRELHPSDSVWSSARSLCDAAVRLADIDVACVLLNLDGGQIRPIAISGSNIIDPIGDFMITIANAQLVDNLLKGPYAVSFDVEWNANAELRERLLDDGVVNVVLAPIRFQSSLIGVLAIGSRNPETSANIESRFPLFEELGSYAGSLFGVQATAFEQMVGLRERVLDVMNEQRFHPVFQPMVDLDTRRPVGYEALTRFDDGVAPDRHFADAHAVGLGSELESLVAERAIGEAEFSSELFLSLNFSPQALLDGHAASTLMGVSRPIVIEVTEHDVISDYHAVRAAVHNIPGASLAVDDAGAGYTSLNHILELQPEYVKLDISMIRDIDSNPARQAMVAGMCHFAEQSGTVLIAEGIETEEEAAQLRSLGITLGRGRLLGQGYFYGRPETLSS